MRITCRAGFLFVLTMLVAAECSEAATRTWRGSGADALWSNPDNWVLNLVPADGDDIVFPVTVGNPNVTTNDLTNLLVQSITVSSTRTFSGNAIRLQAGLTASAFGAAITVTIDLPMQLTAAQTWTIGQDTTVTATSNGTIALTGAVLTVDTASSTALSLNGNISGTGGLIKNGPGTLVLGDNNTYFGATVINAGQVLTSLPSALGVGDGTAANGTTVGGDAALSLPDGLLPPEAFAVAGTLRGGVNTVVEVTGPITLTGEARLASGLPGTLTIHGVIGGSGGLRVGGNVFLRNTNTYAGGTRLNLQQFPAQFQLDAQLFVQADEAIPQAPALDVGFSNELRIDRHTQSLAGLVTPTGQAPGGFLPTVTLTSDLGQDGTLVLTGADTYNYRGKFAGEGVIRHVGTGRQIFTGNSMGLQGSLSVEHGTVVIADLHPVPVTVSDDGRLELNGQTDAVTVTGGEISLGKGTLPNQTAGLTLSNATFRTQGLQGAGGSELVGMTVLGPVALGTSTLTLDAPLFAPALNAQFILVDKVQPGPVSGTFAGLPEGAELTVGAVTFRITYVGGDGNDILLTVTKISRDYLLSEGATSNFFTTEILLANPQIVDVPVKVEFLQPLIAPIAMDLTLPARSRKTIKVNDVTGLAGAEFSTQVHALNGLPIVVERTMTWDSSGYGAHTEHAAEALSTTWYFAEGSQGFFLTYLLLANPQDVANVATVQYLRTDEAPIERTYALSPRSRRTVDISSEPALADRSFGMIVTFAQPGMAERAMYFGGPPFLTGGHESAGVTAPSTTWFLPEGATGPFFETFILLANPGSAAVDATVTFLPADGQPVTVDATIVAKGRTTINIEPQHASLANAAVATQVTATGPIIAERAQYWPDPPSSWYEAHNSFGVTELGTKWGLAEGRVGLPPAYQTYILLANPGDTAASVTITFLRDGKAAVTKTFSVPAKSRFNVTVGPGTLVPELQDETFGALIESTQPIAVERAMYSDANGQVWAAGTSATAVRLP